MKKQLLSLILIATLMCQAKTNPLPQGASSMAQPTQTSLPDATAELAKNLPWFTPKTFTLDNGMKGIVIENTTFPSAIHTVLYGVGSVDEANGESGIAHFLEHLMFRGTDKVPHGWFDRITSELGMVMNATTSYDRTNYFEILSPQHLPVSMFLEADRMQGMRMNNDPNFIKSIFEPEQQVVLKERLLRIDNVPESRLWEQAMARMFVNHPYGHPIIGWKKDIERLNPDNITKFYKKYYAPNNATLIVVGNTTVETVKKLAQQYYGHLKPSKIERQNFFEPAQIAYQKIELKDPLVKQPSLTLGYKMMDKDAKKDLPAMRLLMDILVMKSVPNNLHNTLVIKDKKATFVSAGAYKLRDAALLYIQGIQTDGTTLSDLEDAINKQLPILLETLTNDHAEEAKTIALNDMIYMQTTLMGLNNLFSNYLTSGLSLDDIKNVPHAIAAVTLDDIKRVGRAYFKQSQCTASYLLPLSETGEKNPTINYQNDDSHRPPSARPASDAPYPAGLPKSLDDHKANYNLPIKTIDHKGVKAYFVKNKLPVIHLRLALDGGSALDPENKIGLGRMACRLLSEGTINYPDQQFKAELERLSSSINVSADHDGMTISITCLSNNLDKTLSLFEQAFYNPQLDEAAITRIKSQFETTHKSNLESPFYNASRLFDKKLYGDHIYGRDISPDFKNIKAIEKADIVDYLSQQRAQALNKSHMVIMGNIDNNKALTIMKRLIDKFPASVKPANPITKTTPAIVDQTLWIEEDRPQATILFGTKGLSRTNPDFYAFRVLEYLVGNGSFDAILTEEIREKRGLTYGIRCTLTNDRFADIWSGSLSTNQPEKSIALIKDVWGKLATGTPEVFEDARIERAKKALVGRFSVMNISTNRIVHMMDNMLNHNLPITYPQDFAQSINKITPQQVRDMAKKYMDPKQLMFVVIGKKENNKNIALRKKI
jgi:zinc protease